MGTDSYLQHWRPFAVAHRGSASSLDEALQLRAAGVRAPLLAWLLGPGERWVEALGADVDLSVSAPWVLDEITEAAREVGCVARVHLKVDSGLGRSGAPVGEWPLLVDAARKAEARWDGPRRGSVVPPCLCRCARTPHHRSTAARFTEAIQLAEASGLTPEARHLDELITYPTRHTLRSHSTWTLRVWVVAAARCSARRARPSPRDDIASQAVTGQTCAVGSRGLVLASVRHPARPHWVWFRLGMPTVCLAMPLTSDRFWWVGDAERLLGWSAWISSCSTLATT